MVELSNKIDTNYNVKFEPGVMARACNLNYSAGRQRQEDCELKAGYSNLETLSQNQNQKGLEM